METEKIKQIIEALIFAADTPLSPLVIQSIVEEVSPGDIRSVVDALNLEYKQTGRGFHIVQVAGGYQMVTRESFAPWIKKLFEKRIKTRLSQAALETLSVIAFKQPVSKPEIDQIRGVSSDGVIRTLLERKLITISGRADGPGRPMLYRTTQEFLVYFGVNNISDLPKPREIEDILREEQKESDTDIDMDVVSQILGAGTEEDAVE